MQLVKTSGEYHQVGDKIMTDKGKFYTEKRKRGPKEGPRVHQTSSERSYAENHGRIFGVPTCKECGVEVLRGRNYCDQHKDLNNEQS